MKETFYFSHDYNARNDEKIIKLLSQDGAEGYGIFWMIIEKLYEAGGYLKCDYECIAFDIRTSCECIERVINKYGLFIIDLDNNTFYSESVLERLAKRQEKSEKAKQSAKKRWDYRDNNANALPTHCEANAIKESKVKEIKVNNTTIEREQQVATPNSIANNFFTSEDKQKEALKLLVDKNIPETIALRELNSFIMYWTEPNSSGTKQRWQMEKTFEISRRLTTWFSRVNKFNKVNKITPTF